MNLVQSLGCYCCANDGFPGTPAQLHHPRETCGMGERALDVDVIPLCVNHHTGPLDKDHASYPGGVRIVSVHKDYKEFVDKYGNEYEIVDKVVAAVKGVLSRSCGVRFR